MNGRVVLGFRREVSDEGFDSLTDGIFYYVGTGSYSAPISSPGFVEAVTDGTHIFQRFTTIGSCAVFVRTYDGQNWSNWIQQQSV